MKIEIKWENLVNRLYCQKNDLNLSLKEGTILKETWGPG